MVPIGFPTTPEIIYGFGLSFGLKGFDCSFFFQGLARESFWISYNGVSPFFDNNASFLANNQLGGCLSAIHCLLNYYNTLCRYETKDKSNPVVQLFPLGIDSASDTVDADGAIA